MTQETICPACGAPLVVTGGKEAVRCTFCGADLTIQGEGGEATFQVVGQPEPQKQTLSKPVEGRGDENEIGGAQIYSETQPADAQPIASAGSPASAPFQPDMVSGGMGNYQTGAANKGTSGTTRWLAIGGAVLLGLILLCACILVIFVAVRQRNGF